MGQVKVMRLLLLLFIISYYRSNAVYRKVDGVYGNPEDRIEYLWPIDFDFKAGRGKGDPKRDKQVLNILEDIQKFLINLFFLPSNDVETLKLDFYNNNNNSSKLNKLHDGIKRALRVLGKKNEFTIALNGTSATINALFKTTNGSCGDSSSSSSGETLKKFNKNFDSTSNANTNSIKNTLLNIKELKYPIFNIKTKTNDSDAFVFVISDNSWIPGLYTTLTSLALFQPTQQVVVIYIKNMIDSHFIQVLQSMGVNLISVPDFFKGPMCTIKRRGTFLKFYLWTLPYNKVLFIDTDTIITNNLDYMFQLSPKNKNLFQLLASAGRHGLNSGLMLLRPSEYIASKLIRRLYLRLFEAASTAPWYGLTDQEVIQGEFRYYRGNWRGIPKMTVNTVWHMSMRGDLFKLPLIKNLKASHVIHYLGFPKPWHRLLFATFVTKSNNIHSNFTSPVDPLAQFWTSYYKKPLPSTIRGNISLTLTCDEHYHYFDFIWLRFWNTFTQCMPLSNGNNNNNNDNYSSREVGLTAVWSFGSDACEQLPLVKSSSSSSSSTITGMEKAPIRVFFNMSIFDPRLGTSTTTSTTTTTTTTVNTTDGYSKRNYDVFQRDYVFDWMKHKECIRDTNTDTKEQDSPPT